MMTALESRGEFNENSIIIDDNCVNERDEAYDNYFEEINMYCKEAITIKDDGLFELPKNLVKFQTLKYLCLQSTRPFSYNTRDIPPSVEFLELSFINTPIDFFENIRDRLPHLKHLWFVVPIDELQRNFINSNDKKLKDIIFGLNIDNIYYGYNGINIKYIIPKIHAYYNPYSYDTTLPIIKDLMYHTTLKTHEIQDYFTELKVSVDNFEFGSLFDWIPIIQDSNSNKLLYCINNDSKFYHRVIVMTRESNFMFTLIKETLNVAINKLEFLIKDHVNDCSDRDWNSTGGNESGADSIPDDEFYPIPLLID